MFVRSSQAIQTIASRVSPRHRKTPQCACICVSVPVFASAFLVSCVCVCVLSVYHPDDPWEGLGRSLKSSSPVMDAAGASRSAAGSAAHPAPAKKGRRGKKSVDEDEASKKRRCISSACVPCRRRKSKVRYVTDRRARELFLRGLLRAYTNATPRYPSVPVYTSYGC